MSDDANVAQHSFATLQMAKHIPQLGHLRAAAVNDVRKPFFLQPLFTFLSSPTSSAVRDYRSVLFERLQNIYVRSARRFLRSIEWHVESVWPFLGSAICDWEYPVWTPVEFIGWFDAKIRVWWYVLAREMYHQTRTFFLPPFCEKALKTSEIRVRTRANDKQHRNKSVTLEGLALSYVKRIRFNNAW